MGTNYYLRKNICKECARYDELHLGKSSMGWRFTFRAHNDPHIHSTEDWKKRMKEGLIFDEYGCPVSEKEFWEIVEAKRDGKAHESYDNDSWKDADGNDFYNREFS
jgi:hypothetical protein